MHSYKDNTFRLSVRQLVEFIFRSGDLSVKKGGRKDKTMLAGTRIHQKIQKRQGAGYRAEVPFVLTVSVKVNDAGEGYSIVIEGRADGIYEEDGKPAVDEIKGVFKPLDKLTEPEPVHLAQALCYAYMDGIEDNKGRVIRMTYVNLDTEEEKYFYEEHSWQEIKEWFDALIEKYRKWCDYEWNHRRARDASIKEITFPFEYRAGQKTLAGTAYRFLTEEKNLYIQASTGIGKTISTMYPAFKAMGEGNADKIFYLTAKTITATVARETMGILAGSGLDASYVNLTAKEKLCPLEEMECDSEKCPYAKGHFDRINDAVFDMIVHEKVMNRDVILDYANKHMVCPFELSLDASYWVDLIIGDYNYAFDPNVRLARFFADGVDCPCFFLIDEAHNLVDRARKMISADLSKKAFSSAAKLAGEISKKLKSAISSCSRALAELKKNSEFDSSTGLCRYSGPAALSKVFDKLENLMEEFARFYENNPTYYEKEMSEFFFMCRSFVGLRDSIETGYIFYGRVSSEGDFYLTLSNADPSEYLKTCLSQGRGSVLFSATLLPIDYYRSLLTGEMSENAIYARSPFDENKRLLAIATDVTSRYAARGRDQYLRVLEYIEKTVNAKPGHYMVYFPSYAYMQSVYDLAGDLKDLVLMQSQSMDEAKREEYIKSFSEDTGRTMIGFCVLGGMFSEGIDLTGDKLIGVIIIGTGLPGISPERNLIRDYFSEHGQNGFSYAYLYPGIGRVLQAAGRLIRTENDEGVIILLDDRFSKYEYRKLFPVEWKNAEYTTVDKIEERLESFWRKKL